jgi:protocatechuate 3,4-dioxygenase beta subunit
LVFPTQDGASRGAQAQAETELTGFSPLDGDSLQQGEGAWLRFEPELAPEVALEVEGAGSSSVTKPRGLSTSTEQADAGGKSQTVDPAGKSSRSQSTSRATPRATSKATSKGSSNAKDPISERKERALGKLRGRVVWQKTRLPVPGVSMRLYVRMDGEDVGSLSAAEELDGPDSAYVLIGKGICGAQGKFELVSRVGKGQICLVVSAGEDRVGVFSLSMAPQRGEVFDLGELSLEKTGKALGRVLDAEGKPLKNAWVRVASASTLLDYELDGLLLIREPEQRIVPVPDWVRQGNQSAGPGRSRTDSQGFFVVDGVAAGRTRLRVQADQHLPHQAEVQITAGQTSNLGEISMGEGLALGGQLVDQRGMPMREAQLSVGSSGRSLVIPKLEAHVMSRPVFTDENGRFRVTGLAEGDLFVAWRPGSDFDWQVLGPFQPNEDLRLSVDSPFLDPSRVLDPSRGLAPSILINVPGGVPDGVDGRR